MLHKMKPTLTEFLALAACLALYFWVAVIFRWLNSRRLDPKSRFRQEVREASILAGGLVAALVFVVAFTEISAFLK